MIPAWRALPLWAKVVTLPFLISGAIAVAYVTLAALSGLVIAVASAVNFFAKMFDRTSKAVSKTVNARVA